MESLNNAEANEKQPENSGSVQTPQSTSSTVSSDRGRKRNNPHPHRNTTHRKTVKPDTCDEIQETLRSRISFANATASVVIVGGIIIAAISGQTELAESLALVAAGYLFGTAVASKTNK